MNPLLLARIGAVFYVLWSLLHLLVPFMIYNDLAGSLDEGIVRGRIEQTAVFMALVAALSLFTAVRLNWKNSENGFWLNLYLVTGSDLPWIFILVIPGHEAIGDAWPGLVTWGGGVVFTSLAYFLRKRTA